jgi:ribonuclease P protein component
MPVRFGPAVRLHTRKEFTAVQEQGRRVGARHITLVGKPNRLGHDRIGLVASKRLGGAVVRNRAKRRLREVFRRQQTRATSSFAGPGWDVVVIARSGVGDTPFAALAAEFSTALRRLRGSKSGAA